MCKIIYGLRYRSNITLFWYNLDPFIVLYAQDMVDTANIIDISQDNIPKYGSQDIKIK